MVAVEAEADQGNEFFEGGDTVVEFLVFGKDFVVLALDESDGFFGVIEFAAFSEVAQGYEGGYAATGNEGENDGEVFEHGFRFLGETASGEALAE